MITEITFQIITSIVLSVNTFLASSQRENLAEDSTLKTGWYFISDTPNGYKRQLDKASETFYINPLPLITINNMISIEIYQSTDSSYALSMKLDEIGTIIWEKATRETVGRRIAFIVNDKLVYTPKVNSPIYNGIAPLNRGIYSKEELEQIKLQIENKNNGIYN